MFHKSGQKSWHRENQLLIDIPHWDESYTALLDVLLVQGGLVLKNVKIADGDSKQLAEAGQLASLKPCQDLLQVRDGTQVERGLPGHQDMFNHLAGLLIEGGMNKLMKAKDEKLVSLSQQLWCLLVEKAELAQHLKQQLALTLKFNIKQTDLQTKLSHPDRAFLNWARIVLKVACAREKEGQQNLDASFLNQPFNRVS